MDVDIYLPNDLWYDYYSKKCIQSNGSIFTVEAPSDTIPLKIRGGYILPIQDPATTTTTRYIFLVHFILMFLMCKVRLEVEIMIC